MNSSHPCYSRWVLGISGRVGQGLEDIHGIEGTKDLARDRGVSLLRGAALRRKSPQFGSESEGLLRERGRKSRHATAAVAWYFAIGSVGRKEPCGSFRQFVFLLGQIP